jgi:hypothetical protein
MVFGLFLALIVLNNDDYFQPDQPASATRSVLPEYPTSLLFLLFIAGWNFSNPIGTGRVAKWVETRPNRPVPSPNHDQGR